VRADRGSIRRVAGGVGSNMARMPHLGRPCDKNRVWHCAGSVNGDRIVCRIGVGLEKSPGPRPAHPVVPKRDRFGPPVIRLGVRPVRPRNRLTTRTVRWLAQPIIPVMIAKMKLIVPSQSRSPASVPRLAEMRGSMLLCIIGLGQCRPLLTMGRRLGSFVLTACNGSASISRPLPVLTRRSRIQTWIVCCLYSE
jgi:hypothetical protein